MSESAKKKTSLDDLKQSKEMMAEFLKDVKIASDKTENGGAKNETKRFVESCLNAVVDSLQKTKSLSAIGVALRKKASVRPDILRAAVMEVLSEKKEADQRFPALIVTLKKDAYGTPKQKPEQSKSKTELPKDEQSDEALMKKLKELERALVVANESKSKAEQQQECLSDEASKMNKKVEELEGALGLANEELFRLHTERDDPSVLSKTSTKNFPFFKEAYFGLMSLMKDNNINVPERYKNPAPSETVQNDPPVVI